MKNRCIHDGLVDHRGSMEPCRNEADAVHHDPSVRLSVDRSIDRSHAECARTVVLEGSLVSAFFFLPHAQDGNDSSSSSREKFIAYLER